MSPKQQLRKQLRLKRGQLSQLQQQIASRRLLQKVKNTSQYQSSHHIAFYYPINGEISPLPLISQAQKSGKRCYLPITQKGTREMTFAEYTTKTKLKKNVLGVSEPTVIKNKMKAMKLDLVIMPTVGFDGKGRRLGMGGGYYDYTFRFKTAGRPKKPYLLAIAHHSQKAPALHLDPWDIQPDKVIAT